MLKTNLCHQYLSAFTNVYDVPIAMFVNLRRWLRLIVSYSKGWTSYQRGMCESYHVLCYLNIILSGQKNDSDFINSACEDEVLLGCFL